MPTHAPATTPGTTPQPHARDDASPPDDSPATVTAFRIDAQHANPQAAWQKQGSPSYPTAAQLAELRPAWGSPNRGSKKNNHGFAVVTTLVKIDQIAAGIG